MKTYFWTMQHDEGIQDFGTLIGESLRAAIKEELETRGDSFGFTVECLQEQQEYEGNLPLTIPAMVETILEHIIDSYVDGDSAMEIAVFDITDPVNPIRLSRENQYKF